MECLPEPQLNSYGISRKKIIKNDKAIILIITYVNCQKFLYITHAYSYCICFIKGTMLIINVCLF